MEDVLNGTGAPKIPPRNPDQDKAWSKAHPTIRRLAYGVLILLSLSSILLGTYRGRLGAVIISIAVIVSLFLVVTGLLWIADRRGKYWQWLGIFLITPLLAGTALLFLTILFYIGSGYPAWLDVWFGPGITVDAPGGIGVSGSKTDSDAAGKETIGQTRSSSEISSVKYKNVVREDDGSFTVLTESRGLSVVEERQDGGIGLIRSRRSPSMIAPVATYSRKIKWDKSTLQDTGIEVQLRERGSKEVTTIVRPSSDGFAEFTDLLSNRYYDYWVTAIRKGRRSTSITGCFATPLDYYVDEPQEYWANFITYYSSERDCQGRISDPNGTIVYEVLEYFDTLPAKRIEYGQGAARWIYRGEIRDSRPTFNGVLYADTLDCVGERCGTSCKFESNGNGEGEGVCRIFFDAITVQNRFYFGKRSSFEGSVRVGTSTGRALGPIYYQFKEGTLEAADTDYTDVYYGDWDQDRVHMVENTSLHQMTGFRRGALLADKKVVTEDCFLAAVSTSMDAPASGFRATCSSLELGEYRGNNDPYNGIKLTFSPGAPAFHFKDGNRIALTRSTSVEAGSCLTDMFGQRFTSDWELKCDEDRTCRIDSRKVDTGFTLSFQDGKLPNVTFRAPSQSDGTHAILIDGKRFDFAPSQSPDAPLSGLAVLAQFCAGKEFKSPRYPDRVSLQGFCAAAAVAFTRMVNCR
ncbi:hypothetical protein GOL22_27210 [Sinorhizobium medicae]|nr:hypothetical protein [Sinorhizobium medicae]